MTDDSDREGGSSETPLQVPASPPGSPPDFAPAGEVVRRLLGRTGAPSSQRRVAQVWAAAVGPENARNSRPVTLKGGRLICAASSAAWAHSLQMMAGEIAERVNVLLREELVREAVFRVAGWEAGFQPPREEAAAAAGSARGAQSAAGAQRRALTAEEEAAIEAVRTQACDQVLGERIAAAMRADLETRPR
ncbi:MAG: DUF721 domain-containing protein [Thermoleophilia bacterium]|nr:DUF721 domain-containing protein [Thermoleophilia bacterium]